MNLGDDKKNGMPKSIIVHSILLLIAFFYSFKVEVKDPDPDKPYKVVMEVDFREEVVHRPKPDPKIEDFEAETSNSTKSNADEGESRPHNPEVQKVEVNDPKPPAPTENPTKTTEVKQTPTPDSKPISTPDESPVKVRDVPTNDAPKKVEIPPKTTNTNTTPTKKPGAGTVGSPTGTSNKPQSQTDGTGQGKSDKGDGRGSDKGSDVTSGSGTGSDGTGEYDGSGNGIFKRKVIYRNVGALDMSKSGKVVVKTCINKMGYVTYSEILQNESTITDKAILKKTLKAAQGYKYEPDIRAPKEQCGKLTISLDINAFKPK